MPNNMNLEQNNETIGRLRSQFRRKVDKYNCPCKMCKGLKSQRIIITITQSHCRQHGHVEGGHDFHQLMNVDFQLEEHKGVHIQANDNAPMEEDDHAKKNTTKNDGIGVAYNEPEDMIKYDGIGVAN